VAIKKVALDDGVSGRNNGWMNWEKFKESHNKQSEPIHMAQLRGKIKKSREHSEVGSCKDKLNKRNTGN
jgi:hypothetical protein